MTQLEHLKQAVELAEQNPEAEIHILACSEEILDDCAWTGHEISKVELGYWYVDWDKIYTDPFDLAEAMADLEEREVDEDEAEEKMSSAILIYTRAG